MPQHAQRPLAIIQLEAPPQPVSDKVGDQTQWFIRALQLSPQTYRVVRPHLGEALPDAQQVSAAILSGSWAMVTEHADWSERTAAWIRTMMEKQFPLMGVCYGHQLMAYALGGTVADNPRGWERGLRAIDQHAQASADPMLSTLPPRFSAWLSHRQSVLQAPVGAQVLAYSSLDACQVIRYNAQAFSVQFHPEFDEEIMAACSPADTVDKHAAMRGSDWARSLLLRFWQQAQLAPQADRA